MREESTPGGSSMQTMETGGEGDDDDYDDDDEPPNLPDNAVAPPTSAQTWTAKQVKHLSKYIEYIDKFNLKNTRDNYCFYVENYNKKCLEIVGQDWSKISSKVSNLRNNVRFKLQKNSLFKKIKRQ